MAPIESKLNAIWRKNKDDLGALVLKTYPQFVYRRMAQLPHDEIPVFVFHSADLRLLSEQLAFLSANGYCCLTADFFLDAITGKRKAPPKSVVLTFDDGRSSVWTTAYPLLKRYGFQAVCFLVPKWIEDGKTPRANLEDLWTGCASIDDIRTGEIAPPLCTWQEIELMHRSGVIDFQSHSFSHASIFTGSRILDFVRPMTEASFLSSDFQPILRGSNGDQIPATLPLGQPIFPWQPLFAECDRYLENGQLSASCAQLVLDGGGPVFFSNPRWRRRLRRHVAEFQRSRGAPGRLQSRDERMADMIGDLAKSRVCIEAHLEKTVRHLCYPWYVAGPSAVMASRQAGFAANYWGIVNRRAINRLGDDPYHVARLSDDYLLTLPGIGRHILPRILADKTMRILEKHLPARSSASG